MNKKLFELLAVERDLAEKSKTSLQDARKLFESSTDNFIGIMTKFVKLREDVQDLADEKRSVPYQVDEVLDESLRGFAQYVNTTLAKEVANTTTNALVDIDSIKFELPATALLNLEARLDELHKLISAIPALPIGESWEHDDGLGLFVAAQRNQLRTQKTQKVIVLYTATENHPAQTELVSVDEPAYEVERTVYSGMITEFDKGNRLLRLEALQRAVKQARQRANTVETKPVKIAAEIIRYVNGN